MQHRAQLKRGPRPAVSRVERTVLLSTSAMNRIRALNDSSQSSSDSGSHSSENGEVQLTKEAQEEQLFQLYSQALVKIKDGCESEAKEILLQLLEKIKSLQSKQLPAMLDQLKFSIYKNLGSLIEDDINHWMDALDLDPSDVNLWIKAGSRAYHVLRNYQLARNCFHSALMLSPNNWIALDSLLDCYFILHDLYNVVITSVQALEKDPSYSKAQILLLESCHLNPSWKQVVPKKFTSILTQESLRSTGYASNILNRLNSLKESRYEQMLKSEKENSAKRQKLFLSLEVGETPIKIIGNKLLKAYETLNKPGYTVLTPIELTFEKSIGQKEELISTVSSNEESSSQEMPKENGREKSKKSSKSSNANAFPIEYLDKRRSSRVQRQMKGSATDSKTVHETLIEMLPTSIKDRILESDALPELVKAPVNPNLPVQEIEKQTIHRFIDSLKSCSSNRPLFLCDIIYTFLIEISKSARDLTLPNVFSQLYGIYRKHNPLPAPFNVKFGYNMTVEQAELILVANEVYFRLGEEIFLSSITNQLEEHMDEESFTRFLVRLLYLRGTNSSGEEVECLEEVLSILSEKNLKVEATGKTIITSASVKSSIGSKSEDGLAALLKEKKYEEVINLLFNKSESEITTKEEEILFGAISASQNWKKGIGILSQREKLTDARLNWLLECVTGGDRAKVDFELAQQLVKLATEKFSIKAWCALLWIFISESNVKDKKDDSRIINFIHTGHQFLGRKGICTGNSGEFLLLCLDYLINKSPGNHRYYKEYASDCFTCLFRYPAKRSPPHTSNEIQLEWKHASLLFDFTAPEDLPEYDSNKTDSITVDTEGLYTQLVKLVPEECRADQQSKIIAKYLKEGNEAGQLDTNYDKPIAHPVTIDLYYLLADYYFKNKEFKKAKFFFLQDLGMNPDRFDSWASYSLIRSYQLEHHWLQRGDNWTKAEADTFFRMAESAFRCYKQALTLKPENSKILIEYANLVYNVASQTSRLKKYVQTSKNKQNQQPTGFDTQLLRTKQREFLGIAKQAFLRAVQIDLEDEQWLPFYLLGKISEKGGQILQALRFYEFADLHLYTAGAEYPRRIQYYSPPNLSIEALEVYYRIHVCILKYLTLSGKQNIPRQVLLKFKNFLTKASNSPIAKLTPLTNAPKTTDIKDVASLVTDVTFMVQDRFSARPEDLKAQIIAMCLEGLTRVLTRFPEHYKALYRLAFYYYGSNEVRTAHDILLKPNFLPPIEPQGSGFISGLFSDRKPNNLFNGIWRIPVDEIDRPGGFPSHMYRSAFLLVRLSTALFDYETLSSMAMQLSRSPDAGKKYLREGERLLLARESFDACSSILKNHMLVLSRQNGPVEAFLQQVNKTCEKLVRANVFAEEANRLLSYCFNIFKNRTSSNELQQHGLNV